MEFLVNRFRRQDGHGPRLQMMVERVAHRVVDLVPLVAHEAAIADSAGVLRAIDTAVHGNRPVDGLDDHGERQRRWVTSQLVAAIDAAPGLEEIAGLKAFGHLGDSCLGQPGQRRDLCRRQHFAMPVR